MNHLKQSRNAQLLVVWHLFSFPLLTENVKIQHVLEISQKASKDVGQSYTTVTFDSGVAQKYILLSGKIISDLVMLLPALVFSILCVHYWCIGKHMHGNGFEDVVIGSGICDIKTSCKQPTVQVWILYCKGILALPLKFL